VCHFDELQPRDRFEDEARRACDPLGVRQVARVLVGDNRGYAARWALERQVGQQLANIADASGELARLVPVGGIIGQELGVLLHCGAATRRVNDDSVRSLSEKRIDVSASETAGRVGVAVVGVQRATANLRCRGVYLAAV
jgi:hypothetical protein